MAETCQGLVLRPDIAEPTEIECPNWILTLSSASDNVRRNRVNKELPLKRKRE
jgi:hypothetical protein